MLAPDSRTLLLDALRPPVGSTLDYAVATTFTLDLSTTLMAPLALAGFNLSGEPNLAAVTEALTRTAKHFDVFAQAGMLRAGAWPGDLSALLEDSIHTVRRPRPGHLFHPKLWVLRFVDNDEYSYRCIVTSRNLTADRSWDVILRLDSDPDITRVNSGNDGLSRLLTELPGFCTSPLPTDRRERVLGLASELRRVWWQMPEGIESARFLAFGIDGGTRRRALGPLFRGYRHLIAAPFLTADGLEILLGDSAETELTIVSRPEELDALATGSLDDSTVYTLHPDAGLGDQDTEDAVSTENMLGGLHAKLYVIESNKRSFVYIGSPNATEAAFDGNIEILCELAASTKLFGVNAMTGEGAAFRELLRPYTPPDSPTADDAAATGRRLDAWIVDAAEAGFGLDVLREGDLWSATLGSDRPLPSLPLEMAAEVHLAPCNFRMEQLTVVPGEPVHFVLSPRAAADLTPFFALTVTARAGDDRVTRTTIVLAAMSGQPERRLEDLLLRQLNSREDFLQFILLVLAMGGDVPTGIDASLGGTGTWSAGLQQGLLELLVRALAVKPEAVDRLAAIVDGFDSRPDATSVLPEGWTEVWPSIRRARELIGREKS